LRKLASEGCSILYISHKLEEIRSLCDKATVLRSGRVVSEANPANESTESLARMMIGKDIPRAHHATAQPSPDPRLRIEDVCHVPDDPFGSELKHLSLSVAPGEIVGIAGVSGNGQSELMRLVSGEVLLKPPCRGAINIDGHVVNRLNPIQRRRLGLNFVPEERLGRGAVPDLSLAYNGLLTGFEAGMSRLGLIRFGVMRTFADTCITNNDVRCSGNAAMAGSLSGGNLQKYIVGRELSLTPRLLVLSQPTWGLDVGAAANIRQALIDLRDDGVAVLVVSEELEELFEIPDRLQVIYHGQLSPSLNTRDTTANAVGQWMSGMFLFSTPDNASSAPTSQAHAEHNDDGHV